MASPQQELVFYVNGKRHSVKDPEPDATLLHYLRGQGLTGTKLGCGEGGCGACTVMLSHVDHTTERVVNRAANACLAPLCSLHGYHVVTVEGLGSTKTILHPIQEKMSAEHATQCGFCTPGIVMSLYTLMRNNPNPTVAEIDHCLDGNLCRCTGYRPILQAARQLSGSGSSGSLNICPGSGLPCECGSVPQSGNSCVEPNPFAQHALFPLELRKMKVEPLHFTGKNGEWFRPVTMDELLVLKARFQGSMRIVVGHTEIGIETKFKGMRYQAYVNPSFVPELSAISETEGGVQIGAAVTLSGLCAFLRQQIGNKEKHLTRGFKSILQQVQRFSSTQIRNVASVAGNIVTASPISDLNPLFSALGCKLVLRSASDYSVRELFVRDFFLKYRVVDLKSDEIVESLFIPFTDQLEFACAYKQARRREDDIAIVNAGMRICFALSPDNRAIVNECWLSFGGMAPTTVSAKTTQELLRGRQFDKETLNFALEKLAQDLPLADNAPGGMIEYRRSLVLSFFFKFYLFVVNELSKQDLA